LPGGPFQPAETTHKPNEKRINQWNQRFRWFIIHGKAMGAKSGEQVDTWQPMATTLAGLAQNFLQIIPGNQRPPGGDFTSEPAGP
jgi:hypothetical protein